MDLESGYTISHSYYQYLRASVPLVLDSPLMVNIDNYGLSISI